MKFSALAILSCSLLLQSSAAHQVWCHFNDCHLNCLFASLLVCRCPDWPPFDIYNQPTLRKLSRSSKDEVEKCFEKCGSKNYKSDKLVECQNECVVTSESNGRTRSSVGPTGMYRKHYFLVSSLRFVILSTQNTIDRRCWWSLDVWFWLCRQSWKDIPCEFCIIAYELLGVSALTLLFSRFVGLREG